MTDIIKRKEKNEKKNEKRREKSLLQIRTAHTAAIDAGVNSRILGPRSGWISQESYFYVIQRHRSRGERRRM